MFFFSRIRSQVPRLKNFEVPGREESPWRRRQVNESAPRRRPHVVRPTWQALSHKPKQLEVPRPLGLIAWSFVHGEATRNTYPGTVPM